jgi:hypothetical protein
MYCPQKNAASVFVQVSSCASHLDSIAAVGSGNRKVTAIIANGFTYNDYWWASSQYQACEWIAYE